MKSVTKANHNYTEMYMHAAFSSVQGMHSLHNYIIGISVSGVCSPQCEVSDTKSVGDLCTESARGQ